MKTSLVTAAMVCCTMLLSSCEIDNSDSSPAEYREQIVNTGWELTEVMDHNNAWQPAELYQQLDLREIWFQPGNNFMMRFCDPGSYAATSYVMGSFHIENGTINMTDYRNLDIAYQLKDGIFGPYFKSADIGMVLDDDDAAIEEYSTDNSTNLDLKVNMPWSSSYKTQWLDYAYTGKSPKYNIDSKSHTRPGKEMYSDFTVSQSWVWSLATDREKVQATTSLNLCVEWLAAGGRAKNKWESVCLQQKFYNPNASLVDIDYPKSNIVNYDDYGQAGYLTNRFQNITCPPRFKQIWTASVECDDADVDTDKIETELMSQLGQYIFKDKTFFTKKACHSSKISNKLAKWFLMDESAADSGDSTPLEIDEMATYIMDAFSAFIFDADTKTALMAAGKAGGVKAGGKYKIVWKCSNNDACVQEDYTVVVE